MTGAMEGCRSIVARFPEHELEIHRACARDDGFRAICADYEDAVSALRRFEETGDRRGEEYATIAGELEEEILELLERSRAHLRRSRR